MLLSKNEPRTGGENGDKNGDSAATGSSLFKGGLTKPATEGMPRADADAGPGLPGKSRQLIVGKGISLSGEITACDRLIVEGTAKVVLNQTRAIEIAESGIFTEGKAEVEEAEISGVYEGELTVRGRLMIRATGRVSGTVKYGELEVERGGRLTGTLARRDGGT